MALREAARIEELERSARSLQLLLQTLEDLYGVPDLRDLLVTIVDRAIRLGCGDRGALLLAVPGCLEAGVARDAAGRDLPAGQALSRSLPARALESGHAVVLTDAQAPEQRERATDSVLRRSLRSVLCVPLPGPQGPIGVLYVEGHRPAQDFGPDELAVFEALAVHGAVAIERARLREAQSRNEREARRRLEAENAALRARLDMDAPIGESGPMRRVLDTLRRVADSDVTVCLAGETGTGKEVLARHLHRLSPRAAGPFVVVDCGAIPEGLIESELFGHEKGAFTGASSARDGRFREADGGTLFLDEIGELPLALQTRLLRVLQERTVQPVGGSGPIPVDVRVVCATHQDLARATAEGRFRQDLFYRISVLTIPVPPLRHRGSDVLHLAESFLRRFAPSSGDALGFTHEAAASLQTHSWPGNVRELENRVHRAVLLSRSPYLTRRDLGLAEEEVEDLAERLARQAGLPPLPQARLEASERFELAYVQEALRRTSGNVSHAADLAGVSRQMFQRLLRRHRVDRGRFAG